MNDDLPSHLGGGPMLRILFIIFIAAVTIAAPIIYAGPQLASDLKVGGQWTLAPDLAIKESKCTTYYLIVSTCYIDYINRQDAGRVGGSLNYFVLGSWAGEHALLLRSKQDSSRIGSTIGVEHMRQRLVSFGVAILVALGFLVAVLKALLMPNREDEPAAMGASFESAQPVPPTVGKTFGQRASRA